MREIEEEVRGRQSGVSPIRDSGSLQGRETAVPRPKFGGA